MRHFFLLWVGVGIAISCNTPERVSFPQVLAEGETEAVLADPETDAADDPAIWIHPQDPQRSIIFGSNKTYGIDAFDLSGTRVGSYEVGRINNIDIRYGFPLSDSSTVDILAGTERNNNQILVFAIDPEDGSLEEISGGIQSTQQEVYGFCLYQAAGSQKFYAFLNDKNGTIEQWALLPLGTDSIQGEWVRNLSVGSQPEGMVADDVAGQLYVGEENRGIWRFGLEAREKSPPYFIEMSTEKNPAIAYDIEGLAIYAGKNEKYLLASSQGNNSYAVFDMKAGYAHVGSFQIAGQASLDGTEDTDGIEVTSTNVGGKYQTGLFVAQDGRNLLEEGTLGAQNFKWVSWESIAQSITQSSEIE